MCVCVCVCACVVENPISLRNGKKIRQKRKVIKLSSEIIHLHIFKKFISG